jgi:two-component system sensor histidine kinase/response regulator
MTVTQSATILVVEDDTSTREMIVFLLTGVGYHVLSAKHAGAALNLLESTTPDLIISDVNMPGIDGFEFCRQVRAQTELSQIPFLFLSARAQRTDIRRGMGLGADDYLTKPFETEDLLSAIEIRLARAVETQALIQKASTEVQREVIQALTHEFRTPLSLVVGYTDLLEAKGHEMEGQDFQLILQGLHAGSQRLASLVEDFLLLSKLQTGEVARLAKQHCCETFEPGWVVRQVVAAAKPSAEAKNIQLKAHDSASGVAVAIDTADLREIVHRIVDNAIKFTPKGGGPVSATSSVAGDSWQLEVVDHGIGIHKKALDWIFEAFRQVDRDRLEQQGSGLGLTIVRGLLEAYDGRIAVESAPGKGSTFTLWLPLVSGRDTAPAAL